MNCEICDHSDTVRSRYKRQLIQLKMSKKWPTLFGMDDSRPIFSSKRFSYNENALYTQHQHFLNQIRLLPQLLEYG